MRKVPRKLKIFLLIVMSLVLIKYVFFRAPSEAQMLARFHEHKADFEQLRSMLKQDKKIMEIGPDWIRSQDWDLPDNPEQVGISKQRLAQYHNLMNKIGVTNVGGSKNSNYVQFDVFGGGFADTTWGIGYAWSKKPPRNIVKSAYHTMPIRDGRVHSLIEGNWYIFHRG
jgi:hypothetical protein